MAVGALLALSPAYPVLFASGAVWIESLTRRGNLRRFALASLTVLAAGGAALGLIALPILHVKADLEVGFGLPIELFFRQRDVGLALARVVAWQRPVHEL